MIATMAAPWGELDSVDPARAATWQLAEDFLPGGWRVATGFSVVRFSPAWTVPGAPHHFETLVSSTSEIGNSEATYATEAEARDGHAVIVRRLRTALEARR